jgi:hypothetical protein
MSVAVIERVFGNLGRLDKIPESATIHDGGDHTLM